MEIMETNFAWEEIPDCKNTSDEFLEARLASLDLANRESQSLLMLLPRVVPSLHIMLVVSASIGRCILSRVHSFSLNNNYNTRNNYNHSILLLRSIMSSNSNNNNNNENANAEYGKDMDQNDLMESDMLVAVDEHDRIIPNFNLSKKKGHMFSEETPRAILHRAFSFFLFNSENQLLLTQRAATKITFPNVWTNTVCSHPLAGMKYPEDDDSAQAYPEFPGIKRAAVRKCAHELGLTGIQIDKIQFISRFHYWAADTITYDINHCPWGEHEVDYILFYKIDQPTIQVEKNDDEVNGYEFVTMEELKSRMYGENDLLWSPWFVGIMERGGWDWWQNIDDALQGKYTNRNITYFDPPKQHMAQYNHPSHPKSTGVLKI